MKFKHIQVGDNILDLTTPVVMTILNVTPDSFYAASRRDTDEAIERNVDDAAANGAAIIDVGGYSSRPGAADVSPDEEFNRVARGFRVIRKRHPRMIVSIDTFRASVARRAVAEFGPCIINDISAGDLDPDMLTTVAGLGVPYIAMHMRANPATMQQYAEYDDVTDTVKEFFVSRIEQIRQAGIANIILDPGFGFAKTTRQNYKLMSRMHELLEFGYPVLSGISRKSMIYKVLGTTPAEALIGTAVLNWESLRQGASILRVHDTREAVDTVKLFNYFKESK